MKFTLEVWLEEGKWAVKLDDQIIIWQWSTQRVLKLLKMLMEAATSREDDL